LVVRAEYDGFRGLADTINGKMLSKNRNHLRRFDALLSSLPGGCIFDGEIVVLDEAGRPRFNALMFRRRQPTYVAFDVLYTNGRDLRSMPFGQNIGSEAPISSIEKLICVDH
jgi:ATP-dependent DNA ligase